MESQHLRILLVEDDADQAYLLARSFETATGVTFHIEHVESLGRARARMAQESFDVLLVDLNLPDSHGLGTFDALREQALETPVVVVTGLEDESVALRAVQEGAQDYLIKGHVDGRLLVRCVRYAIERHRMVQTLAALSLLDELTGLYNRRGLLNLGEQQLKLADRNGRGLAVVVADLDGLKTINDTRGHAAGDGAIRTAGEVLRRSFRETDVLARTGGDEFAAIAVGAYRESPEILLHRIRESADAVNAARPEAPPVRLSLGAAHYEPGRGVALQSLLEQADEAMYADKRARGAAR
jgi:diguanylate cyclase (GGDEF)-like protein